MYTRRVTVILLIAIGVVLTGVLAQPSEQVSSAEQPVDQDLYVAGRDVHVRASVDGDVVAAGQSVIVDAKVTGDVIAAGRMIEVRSEVHDDLRVAGQHIRITSTVAGHLAAAGETITISQDVGDWAWLAGNRVEVLGDVGGDLSIRARKIIIDGKVDGNVRLIGNDLSLGPNANVRGDLNWQSKNQADISPEATIGGQFIEEPVPGFAEEMGAGGGLTFTLSVLVAVIALFLVFSRPLRASADRIAAHPVASLMLGIAVSAAMPLLAVFLLFTPLDAWLGLAVLGVYVVVLFLSVLTGLFAISDLVLRRLRPEPAVWQALAAIIVTVVAVGLLSYVPVVGFIGVLGIWLLGVGSLCWGAWMTLGSRELASLEQS